MPIFNYTGSGGLKFGGSAPVASSKWSYVASGGLKLGGSSVSSSTWRYTASGTLRFGGSAVRNPISYYTASGTLRLAGSATANITRFTVSASGGISLKGSANLAVYRNPVAGAGGLKLGSGAGITVQRQGSASGGSGFHGGASASIVFYYTASGGLNSGQAAPFIVSVDFIKEFTWDIGEGVLRNWRVLGKCTPANHPCPPTNVQDNGCPPNGSTMQFMMNVQAHSLTDLCQRLQARGWNAPIQKIQVWSQPVNKSDWTSKIDPSCNTLTTVDFSKIPECINYTVDQDVLVTGKFSASVLFEASYSYTMSGGLGTKPAASKVVSSSYRYVMSGGLGVAGSAAISSPQFYRYVMSGGLGTRGAAIAVPSDYGTRGATGKFFSVVLDLGITFGSQSATILTPSATQVPASCCSSLNLPQILFVRHDLNRSKTLTDFLNVNGLTLDPIQKLMYNRQRNAWYTNLQYRGISVDQTEQQIWNIVFEFGCLTENALLGIPANVWGFSILLRKRSLANSRIEITRLVLEFDPTQICTIPGALKFDFNFNTSSEKTTPPVVRTAVFLDELDSFQGTSFRNNPNASFEVSATVPNLGAGMFDQSIPFQNVLLGA